MSLRSRLAEQLVEPLRGAHGAPDSIARGAALGAWVAMTPTVGIQMFVVGMLGIPLRANIPVAVALVWVSNPLTMVPLYFLFYWLGTLVLAEPGLTYAVLSERLESAYELARGEGLWAGLADLFATLGSEVVWPMTIGSFILATGASVLAYHGVLLWARRRSVALQTAIGTPPATHVVQAPDALRPAVTCDAESETSAAASDRSSSSEPPT